MSLPFITLSFEAIKAIESIKLYTSEILPAQLIPEKNVTKACRGCYLFAAIANCRFCPSKHIPISYTNARLDNNIG